MSIANHPFVPKGRVWRCGTNGDSEPSRPSHDGTPLGADSYDVTIIGAGVVGCALAYRLSQFQLKVLLIDKNFDVGEGASKGNSAIIHTGFDAPVGSLEAQLVTRASRTWPQLAERLKVPFKAVSALLLALNRDQADQLGGLYEKSLKNGVDDVELIDAKLARGLEPNVNRSAHGGLLVHRESIIDPFGVCIAFAEVALVNGVDILLGSTIVEIEATGAGMKRVTDHSGRRFATRLIVNVAGLGSRRIVSSYGGQLMELIPRRGQFLVFDKALGSLVQRIILPVPTSVSKGKLIAPTVFGNLIAGPTAEDLPADAVDCTETTVDGLNEVRRAAIEMCPALETHRPIASYAGLRCHCLEGTYQIRINDGLPGIVTVSGIRSTGLTSSPALADYLVEQLVESCDLKLAENPAAIDSRPERCWPGWWRHPWDDDQAIARCSEYAHFVCFCERVSRGEVDDSLNSPLCPQTLDSLKRRTRVLTGRCQGFQCRVPLAEILADRLGTPIESVTQKGPGTELIPQSASIEYTENVT